MADNVPLIVFELYSQLKERPLSRKSQIQEFRKSYLFRKYLKCTEYSIEPVASFFQFSSFLIRFYNPPDSLSLLQGLDSYYERFNCSDDQE